MGFESLLGNQRLKDNLISSLRRGRASHFYLITGPEGSGKRTLARLLAAALLCADPQKPCGSCTACRKALSGTHPDIIPLEDPEHKKVAVKLVREMRDDLFIRPNEGEKKIYICAQELGTEGQNALLKILEEPPSYGVFLLLSDNPEKLLPTVRSRCVELKLLPLPEQTLRRELSRQFPQAQETAVSAAIARSGGYLGQAKALLQEDALQSPQTAAFVDAYAKRDAMAMTALLVSMEKWKRDQWIPAVQQWQQILSNAQVCRAGLPASAAAERIAAARSGAELHTAIDNLNRSIEYAQQNVSVATLCGWLQWALR